MNDVIWPLRGLLLFLRHPSWWIRPLFGMLFGLLAFIGIGVSTAWFLWPTQEEVWYWWWWWMLFAIGMACTVVVISWVLLLPILMSLILESLARQVLTYVQQQDALGKPVTLPAWRGEEKIVAAVQHIQVKELALVPGILASIKVMGGTLVPRISWSAISLITGMTIPPAGMVVSATGMGHIACMDACDIVLSLYGLNGQQRLEALRAHRSEIRQAALTAGLLNLGLAVTVIGWLLWLPGIIVGAVLKTQSWKELTLSATASEKTDAHA